MVYIKPVKRSKKGYTLNNIPTTGGANDLLSEYELFFEPERHMFIFEPK